MVVGWRGLLLSLTLTIFAATYALTLPVDMLIESSIGKFNWRPVSGDIVVVGIDDKTLASISDQSQSIPLHAQTIDALNRAGAKRVFIDFVYNDSVNDPAFDQLATAVRRMGHRAILAVPALSYQDGEAIINDWPSARFGPNVQKACTCWEYRLWQIWDVPLVVKADDLMIPSFAALLAKRDSTSTSAQVSIDYSYDTNSIQNYSAADVIAGNIATSQLQGKDVIFASMSSASTARHYLPGHNLVPGAHIHLIAGETLKRGMPTAYGWYAALIPVFAISFFLLWRNLTKRFLLLSLALGLTVIGCKILLAQFLIYIPVGAALMYLAILAYCVARRRHSQSAQHQNPVSGLPNFNAMRAGPHFGNDIVVVAKILNFDELVTFLSPDASQQLTEQVARRLQLSATGKSLHHDVDGIFAWRVPLPQQADLEAQLAGLGALFHSPLAIDERRIDVSVAFGINAQFDDSNAQRLAAARGAAERAIRNRSLYEHHAASGADEAAWKFSFHSQLEEALADSDIWVAFQPQFDLKSGSMIGMEALARWTHPTRGVIPPDEFIIQAEQSHDIYQLTLFIIYRAIHSGAELSARGHDLAISVNLSASLLDQPDLASTIQDMLREQNFPASRLTIEITETAQFENSPCAMHSLSSLRQAGVRLSVDDYGTGQSNLEYLIRIEADEIKIDKQFVTTMRESKRNFEIVKSTIDLAHRLGAIAVAEGIENEETRQLLGQLGCDIGQGYHLGKPQPFFEILTALNDTTRAQSA